MAEQPSSIEARWIRTWDLLRRFEAPARAPEGKFYNYDSGPFPSGPLHMGHVRTYVLGDMTARYQRLRGRSVLYCTEFDAFGLPNELAAAEAGCSPADHTQACIEQMRSQLRALGISYDWRRVPSTSDPQYCQWTQRLFLRLRAAGLAVRRAGAILWCPRCETAVARLQVTDGRCWRCETAVVTRRRRQWHVRLGDFLPGLRERLDRLEGWSGRARRAVAAMLEPRGKRVSVASGRIDDWLISRQRAWGTPIPIVRCRRCGDVDVPDQDLPVRLPPSLSWGRGSQALPECRAFVETTCPICGAAAERETDTLDCFFDDVWCFLAALVPLDDGDTFAAADRTGWLPVDRFHSGFDTMGYLHVHRFLGAFLNGEGLLRDPELIASYMGHDMVLAGGRKMSKHLGNVVSPEAILCSDGADVLRIAVLWAAAPERTIDWSAALLDKSRALMARAWGLFSDFAASVGTPTSAPADGATSGSRAAMQLRRRADECADEAARFIEEYRPNAAVEGLAVLVAQIDAFLSPRLSSRRLSSGDSTLLAGVLADTAVMLAPFAPFAAEEFWCMLGRGPSICHAAWPAGGRDRAIGAAAGAQS